MVSDPDHFGKRITLDELKKRKQMGAAPSPEPEAPAPRGRKAGSRHIRATKVTKKITRAAKPAKAKGEWKPICRHCGSKDLAPSFIKRQDARCRDCFKKRCGSGAKPKRAKK